MQLVDGPGSVMGNLQYAPGAIDPELVAGVGAAYTALLRAALADPEAPLAAASQIEIAQVSPGMD